MTKADQLLRCAPYFPVADVEQSIGYYERVLGFQREYVAGAPAQFAIVSREGLPIMLRREPRRRRPTFHPAARSGGFRPPMTRGAT